MNTLRPWYILPVIIFAQFAGTSLWFAGNAVLPDLQKAFNLAPESLGAITSSVQFGFIIGTLLFAFFLIADRFSPSKVFFICALLGALFNVSIYFFAEGFSTILVLRFLTGLCLAGIYPVGMKISADWFEKGLGKALGYLVGALVLGTAFPHLVRASLGDLPWSYVLMTVSGLSVLGGIAILFLVPDGPFRRKSRQFDPRAIVKIFKVKDFRSAAFGYFGHMWELYAFWAFVPFVLETYQRTAGLSINVPIWSFAIIAMGTLGCVLGGYASLKIGSGKVAFIMLLISGLGCLISPFLLQSYFFPLVIAFLLIWGFAVVGDSPQFSTLVALTAPKEFTGSALTIVNSLGFFITIFSIELLNVQQGNGIYLFWWLLPGPLFGSIAIWKMVKKKEV
jgi:MFS family permease